MDRDALRPLEGVRVLDLSRVLAGPVCSMVLGDLGADVVKVERPGRGDDTRQWGPPFIDSLNGMSAYFASVNRNKRSIALEMSHPAGREVLHRLVRRSDVILENFLPDSAAKLGIDAKSIAAINPSIIVCSISGFGRSGPLAQSPGYDFVIQALSGLMSITGESRGEPMKVGVALTDMLTGLYSAIGVLAALLERPQTRAGSDSASGPAPRTVRHLDLALLDCTLASLVNVAQAYLVTNERPDRYGNAHPHIVPYECFATADGHLVLAVGNDEQWRRFCIAVDREDLARDTHFATNPLRVTHRQRLVGEIRRTFQSQSTGYWTERLSAAQVPHAPVLSLDQVFAQPQVRARATVAEIDGLQLVANPIRVDGATLPLTALPPLLGQHTAEILHELGYAPQQVDELRAAGAVA